MTTAQTICTTRFGELTFEPDDLLILEQGLIGFPLYSRYLVIQHREGSQFFWLQSVDAPELAFLVVDPAQFVADYAPEVSISTVADLGIDENVPQLVYTVVNIPRGKPNEMTLNLAGPIVINLETRRGKQIVLEDSRYSLKHRVTMDRESNAA